MANVLVFLNSTLNPFLYHWKIKDMRQAVKQTIRQTICLAQVLTHFDVYMFLPKLFNNDVCYKREEDIPFNKEEWGKP